MSEKGEINFEVLYRAEILGKGIELRNNGAQKTAATFKDYRRRNSPESKFGFVDKDTFFYVLDEEEFLSICSAFN
jgi:hypothetical protein